MDEFPLDHSGIWCPSERAETVRIEPETIILGVAWLLAVAQVAIGVARGEAFGPDRGVAVAFAVGLPLLARATLLELVRRLASMLRRR